MINKGKAGGQLKIGYQIHEGAALILELIKMAEVI